jgi:hypothetical protein
MNEVSSRSHCIVTVTVEKALPDGTVQQGKLCMVDLAGRSVAMRWRQQWRARCWDHSTAAAAFIINGLKGRILALSVKQAAVSGLTLLHVLLPCCAACSERAEKTQASGQQLLEGSQINKSLSEQG